MCRLALRTAHIRNSGVPICRQCEFIRLYHWMDGQCTHLAASADPLASSWCNHGPNSIYSMNTKATSPEMDGPLTPISWLTKQCLTHCNIFLISFFNTFLYIEHCHISWITNRVQNFFWIVFYNCIPSRQSNSTHISLFSFFLCDDASFCCCFFGYILEFKTTHENKLKTKLHTVVLFGRTDTYLRCCGYGSLSRPIC